MINFGRNIVLMAVSGVVAGVMTGMVMFGASQGAATATAPAVLSWAEVLEQNPDPKVVTDADFLKRITATGLPWRVKEKTTGIEMLLVPPGKFVMGMSPGDTEAMEMEKVMAEKHPIAKYTERPAHKVTISKPFYLGRTEVTQEQWVKVKIDNPSKVKGDLLPVEQVSFDELQSFLTKSGLRLPTEAEWEYACRAGTETVRYGDLDKVAWHKGNSSATAHPVGQKAPNALGFYDMLGNVFEWCQDWYEGGHYQTREDGVVDPTGPAQSELGCRLLRGGSWSHYSFNCRASQRDGHRPAYINSSYGFRAARTP